MIKIKLSHPLAVLPERATPGSSGFDLHSVDDILIPAGGHALVSTGLSFEIPLGYELQVRPRSGMARNLGVIAHFGTVDSDYRGTVGVILFNHGQKPILICNGDRVAQAVIAQVYTGGLIVASTIGDTERGTGGFGSTGT